MLQRYAFALFVICGVALAAIVMLRPDPAVEFEAALARLEPEDALARIESAQATMKFTDDLHMVHARLALDAGALETARAAFGLVLQSDRHNPEVFDGLATVAALSGDLAGAASFKAKAHALAPDAARRETLGYWYRLLGDGEAELGLLSEVPPRRLGPFERERLARLLVARGDLGAYETLLVAITEAGGADALMARRQRLELAIEAGDPERALALARSWIDVDPGDVAILRAALETFLGRGAVDQAVALSGSAILARPDSGAVAMAAFAESGHGGLARLTQASWLAADDELDAGDWQALAAMAERSGDLSGIRRALERPAPGPVPADAFLQVLRYQGARALLPYRHAISPEILAENPLVAAAWFNWHRETEKTYRQLLAAAEGPLTEWDRDIWMSVAADLRGTPFYRALLAGAPSDAGLRDRLRAGILVPVARTSLEPGPEGTDG